MEGGFANCQLTFTKLKLYIIPNKTKVIQNIHGYYFQYKFNIASYTLGCSPKLLKCLTNLVQAEVL